MRDMLSAQNEEGGEGGADGDSWVKGAGGGAEAMGRSVSSPRTAPEWLAATVCEGPSGSDETVGSDQNDASSRPLSMLSPALDRAMADAVAADPRTLGENLVCLVAEVRRLKELNTHDTAHLQEAYVSYELLRQRLLPLEEGAKEQVGQSQAAQLLRWTAASHALPEKQRRLCGNLIHVIMEHEDIQVSLQRHLDPGARERLFSTSGLLAGPSPNSLQDKIAGDADLALGDSVSLRADLVNRAFATHCMCHWANEVGVPTSVLRGAKQELEAEAHEGNHNFAASYLIPLHSWVAWKEISELVAGQLHASWALRATLAPVLESLARSVRDGVCLDPHLEAHFHADPHKGALSMETLPWYNKYGVAQAVVRSQENALQRCIDIAALALQRFFGSPSDSLPPACLIAAKYACTLAQQAASPAAAEVAGREEKGTSGADMASEEVMRQCALTLVHTFIVTPLRMVLAHKRGPLAPMGSLGGIVPDSAEDAAGRHSEPSPDCTLRGKMLEGLEAVSQLVVAAVLGVEPQPGFLGLVDDEQLARVRAFVQEWAAKSMAALDVLSDSVGRAMTATRCRREHSALLERGVAFANILVPPRMLLRCGDIQQIMHVVEKYYRRPQGARTLTVLSPFMSRAAQAAFVTVCGSTGSSLSPAGIHEALKLLGHRMGEEELATMLGGVASQPSGNVNFAAFAQIASHVMTTEPSTHHRASNAVESLFSAWEEAPFNAAVLDNGAEPTTLVEVFPMVMAGGGNAAPTLASLVQDAYGDNSGLQFVLNELRYVLRSAPATTFERALRGAMEMRGVLPRGVPDSSTDAASAALEEHVSAGSLEADSRSLQTWGLSPGEARRQALDVLAKGSARTNALWQRMRAQLFIDDKAALMVGREGETEDERRDREALLKQVQEMGGKGSSPRGRARRLSLAELASSAEAEGGMARYMTASLLRSDEQSRLEAPVGGMDKLPEGAGGAPAELTESFRAVVLRFAKSAFLRVFMEPVGERLLERRRVRVSATGLPDVDACPSECRPCVRLQVLNDAASAVVFQSETEAVAGSASPEWERVIALPTINRPSQHSVVFTITTETSYGGRKVIGSARRPLSVLDVGTGTCSVVFATAANTQATLSLSVFDCGVAPSEQEAEEAGVAIMQQALPDAAGMVAEGAASRGERVLAFRANRLRIALDHLAAMQKPRLDPGVVHRVMRNVRDGEAGTLALLRYLEARARTRGAAGAGAAHSTLQDQGTAGNSSTVGSAGLCTNSDATLPSLARSQSAGSELRVLDLVEELCATPHSESRPPRTMKTLLETVPECAARNLKEAQRWADRYKQQCAVRKVVQSALLLMQEKAASFERVVASINDQVETALPDDIRLHKLFFAPRSRFRVMTVPQLLRSGVLLSSSPIARNKSRRHLRVRLGVDEGATIRIEITRKSTVLAIMESAIEEVVQVHQVGTEHSPRGRLVVEELVLDTDKLIDTLME